MPKDSPLRNFRFTSRSNQSDRVSITIPVIGMVVPTMLDRDLISATNYVMEKMEDYSSDNALPMYVLSVTYGEIVKRETEPSAALDKFKELIGITKKLAALSIDEHDRVAIDEDIRKNFPQP